MIEQAIEYMYQTKGDYVGAVSHVSPLLVGDDIFIHGHGIFSIYKIQNGTLHLRESNETIVVTRRN